jgi:hypothetical protein
MNPREMDKLLHSSSSKYFFMSFYNAESSWNVRRRTAGPLTRNENDLEGILLVLNEVTGRPDKSYKELPLA